MSPGLPHQQSAYRSELAGLFAMVTMIEVVCSYYEIKGGMVELGCDGIQALRQATASTDTTDPRNPQYDLISATKQAMRRCPIAWKTRHIKGHQDNDGNAVLDSWAMLNVEMDGKAKAYWITQSDRPPSKQQRVFGECWALWHEGDKVSSNIAAVITEARHGNKAKEYWARRERFNQGSPEDIDWDVTEAAMKAAPQNRQRWVTKHVSGFCSTGQMMLRWKKGRQQYARDATTSRTRDMCGYAKEPEQMKFGTSRWLTSKCGYWNRKRSGTLRN